jgi:DNA polymerase-3 subunit delta'
MPALKESMPWLALPWKHLTGQPERIPHALLFAGQAGLGKNRLATEFAHFLLCTNPQGDAACGHCKSCELFAAKTHPDIRVVTPLEEGKAISIDQIRELNQFLALTPHTAARQVVIISPAEEMTTAAANSLLKQLEEPPLGSVLILVSHQPSRLTPTIRSRCARIDLKAPDKDAAIQWLGTHRVVGPEAVLALAAAGGAPLAALALVEQGYMTDRANFLSELNTLSRDGNPVTCAERWQKQGSSLALDWFYGFLMDVLKTSLNSGGVPEWNNPESQKDIENFANKVSARQAAELLEVVSEGRRLLNTPVDERLLLEDILIRWNRVAI